MNYHNHYVVIHTFNYITPYSELVHMVNILKLLMVVHGNQGEQTGYGKARKLD
jgi:hypothetical protein